MYCFDVVANHAGDMLSYLRAVAVTRAATRAKQHAPATSAGSASAPLFAPGTSSSGGRSASASTNSSATDNGLGTSAAATVAALEMRLSSASAELSSAAAHSVFGGSGDDDGQGPQGFHPTLHGDRATLEPYHGRPVAPPPLHFVFFFFRFARGH